MVRSFLVLVFAFFATAASAQEQVYPPGSRIGLVPPDGMTVSRSFQGFEDRANGVIIVLTELSAQSYDKIALEFEENAMKAGGLETVSREVVQMKYGGDAVYVIAKQTGTATPVYKWALLARTPDMTVIALATLPEAARKIYSDAAMRTLLTGVTVRPRLSPDDMQAVLPYRLGDFGGFRMLRAVPDGTAIFTYGERDTTLPMEQPYFAIALRGAEPPQPSEREAFARRFLAMFVNRPNVRVVSSEAMRIGGSQGHEIVAESSDENSKDELVLVQWLRFETGGVVQMFGIARKDQWAEMLPKMRTLRDGFALR